MLDKEVNFQTFLLLAFCTQGTIQNLSLFQERKEDQTEEEVTAFNYP